MPIATDTPSTSDRRGHAEVNRSNTPSTAAGVLRLGTRATAAGMLRLTRVLLDYRWELLPVWTGLPFVLWLSDLSSGVSTSFSETFVALVLLLAAFVLARGNWSRSARQRRQTRRTLVRFRRSWPDHALALGLTRINRRGKPVAPRVREAVNLGGGSFRWSLELPRGLTPTDVERHGEALAGAYRASSVMVERDPRRANVAILTVIGQDDPLYGEPVVPRPILDMEPGRDPMAAIPIGYTSTGESATVTLPYLSLLIGGSPGAGKSVLLRCVLAGAALARDTELWLCDPKRVEFGPWRSAAARVAVGQEEPVDLLRDLVREMDRRYAWMEAAGISKLSPSSEWPLIVLVIDELADLFAEGSTPERKSAAKEAKELVRRLVALGRASLVCCVLASQKPDSSTVPTGIRDLIALRCALRCGTEAQAITILGDEAVKELGAAAHALGTDTPGLGYLFGEDGARVTRLRGYYLDDREVANIARRAAEHRRGLASSRFPSSDGSFPAEPRPVAIATCSEHREGGGTDCGECVAIWQAHMLRRFLDQAEAR